MLDQSDSPSIYGVDLSRGTETGNKETKTRKSRKQMTTQNFFFMYSLILLLLNIQLHVYIRYLPNYNVYIGMHILELAQDRTILLSYIIEHL